ncbi:MAG: response regulator [Patulibacter minatonensis]
MPSTPSVLICDDDANIRRLVGTILKIDGYVLSEATDAAGALAAIEAEPPSLVILDLNFPGGGGLAVIEQVRARPELTGTRILLVTGDTKAKEPGWGRSVGADGHLIKPFEIAALREIVGQLVSAAA